MNLHQLYISLGSNMGDKFLHLQKGVDAVFEEIGTIEKISPVYETASWGFEADSFLNAVILVQTNFKVEMVLTKILAIEKKLGRSRKQTTEYESRIIDIDILYFDEIDFKSDSLQVPHPKIRERRFGLLHNCLRSALMKQKSIKSSGG